jgi:hypothetical protein
VEVVAAEVDVLVVQAVVMSAVLAVEVLVSMD